MTYHLARDGTQLGTFEQAELDTEVASGRLRLTDLAWCEGMGDWQPLSTIIKPVEASVVAPPPVPAMPMPPALAISPTGTSGLAITSLVLGIMGIVCGCFTGVPALIFGILAINQIGKSGGTLGGKGIAIAGMVLGAGMMLFGTAVLAGLAIPAFNGVQERARQLQASNNARQIIIAMKAYAGDHNGQYPDADESKPQTSNDAFRLLFKNGFLDDERLFSLDSQSLADNYLGEAPAYADALAAGENAWALLAGVTDGSSGTQPLLLQAPAEATWTPIWNAFGGNPGLGAAGRGGKIIVGRNDGSVTFEKLELVEGDKLRAGSGLFDASSPQRILMPVP